MPGKDLEGIIAVSDRGAIGVCQVLQEQGIKVPGDLFLTGYNTSIEACCSHTLPLVLEQDWLGSSS